MYTIINILASQAGWFACVLGAAYGTPLFGPAVVAAIVGMHLVHSARPSREFALIVSAGLLGAAWDSALVAAGWIEYPAGNVSASLAPYWIVAMWMLFATTLNVSLRWLRERPALAAIVGGISGPLAYYGGAKLGGVGFVDTQAALTALAFGWAAMLSALSVLSSRLDGMRGATVWGQARV